MDYSNVETIGVIWNFDWGCGEGGGNGKFLWS